MLITVTMSIFRNALFMYRGLSEFSKGGYEKAAKTFAPYDLEVDLTGKSYIVTGTCVIKLNEEHVGSWR